MYVQYINVYVFMLLCMCNIECIRVYASMYVQYMNVNVFMLLCMYNILMYTCLCFYVGTMYVYEYWR